MVLTYCHYQGSANANYTAHHLFLRYCVAHSHILPFSPDGLKRSTQHREFSLPYATSGPRHDGQLTCNYCDQTTQANRPVITTIIQIGKTPTPTDFTPEDQRQKASSVLHR